MTPKEKAKELVMRNFEITVDDYCAKQCALIAVDEALSEYVKRFNKMKQLHSYMLDAMQSEGHNYWQEVKKEIENL